MPDEVPVGIDADIARAKEVLRVNTLLTPANDIKMYLIDRFVRYIEDTNGLIRQIHTEVKQLRHDLERGMK